MLFDEDFDTTEELRDEEAMLTERGQAEDQLFSLLNRVAALREAEHAFETKFPALQRELQETLNRL